ncbi:MAG: hypothetical protein Q9206_001363 [Seirophora lacunosa]
MSPNIFVTGATGYIGGDALYELMKRHSDDYQVAALVRNSDKGAQIASQYPNIRLVYGDLDSAETLQEEARKADIVLHCANADHVVAAEALTTGLAAHAPENPGYIIHTSGTGVLMFADMEIKSFGESSSKIYDDWEGVGEVTSIPDFAPHRNVDKIILGASGPNVKPAIVCPPTIYGPGRGPGNQRSHQVPELSRCTLQQGHGVQVGAGKTYWTNVHVHDLSDVFVALVEAAVAGGGKASWGNEGYYFTENGEHVWGDIARLVASAAHKQGFIPSPEVKVLPDDEIEGMCKAGTLLWGANSRCRAVRARKLLGWSPKGISLERDIPDTVASEANIRGYVQHHAAKVAGEEHYEFTRASVGMNMPLSVHQSPPPEPQHSRGYSTSHQYAAAPAYGTSGHGHPYRGRGVVQRPSPSGSSPPASGNLPPSPTFSGSGHGGQRGTMSTKPMVSFTGNVDRRFPDHNVNPNFGSRQTSPPQGETSKASPPGRPKMKHLTCYYWHDKGNCKYPEELCLYKHSYVGTLRIADAPVQKQPGMPAVAGKNALQENPVYNDWTANRGALPQDPRRSTHVTSPETLQEPNVAKTEHALPEEEPSTQVPLSPEYSPEEPRQQEREKSTKREAPEDDDIFASAPHPKALRSRSFPSAEPTPSAAAQETEAQNVLLREAVQGFSHIVSHLLKGRVLALQLKNKGCGTLLDEIKALPGDYQTGLLKPLRSITKGVTAQAAADDEAKKSLDDLREKLVAAGLGDLLTVMDQGFCVSAAEGTGE